MGLARKLLLINPMMYSEFSGIMSSSCKKGASDKLSTVTEPKRRQPSKVGGPKRELLAAERLEAAARLTAWVAHQINNPLGSISGNAQLLARLLQRDIQDADTLKEYMRYLNGICDQTERCARITGEMLSFTQSGEPDTRPVDIHALVQESIDVISYAFPQSNVHFVPSHKDDFPRAKADREWLSRIIFEILSNAVEASDGGDVAVKVRLMKETKDQPSNIHIEVEDSGNGIDDQILPRIFDPFFSTREKARGLGLTLSLEMVRKMGGALQVRKTSDEGTTFMVSIPLWGFQN